MTDGSLAWLAMVAGAIPATRRVPKRGELELNGGIACYLPYEAADGWITCGALEPKFWQAFCRGVDREDLIEKQFERPGSEGWQQIAEIFRSSTRDEWRAFNDEHDAASSRCSTSTRRSTPSSSASARWWSSSTSRTSGPCGCSACR